MPPIPRFPDRLLGLSIQLHKTDQVSCVFLGDAGVEEGVFYESINFAVLKKLPVLFICENNLYSVYSPLRVRQPKGRKIHKMVEAMGVHSGHGDGNDPLQVYSLTKEAVDNIRQAEGPIFLEFATYRWREHCGPNYDNNIGYRSEEEFVSWKAKDPILFFETLLRQEDIADDQYLSSMEREIRAEVSEAFQFAEKSPFPDPSSAFTDLFKE